jgi:tetratricopeptide (TPR) repeat protein
MRLKFPHIPRIFTARILSWVGNLCLWILLLALISFNIFIWSTNSLAYSNNLIDIFTHPFSALVHENLAQTLQRSGWQTLADRELALVAELSPVLSAETTAKEQRREAETIYWQKILISHPDYRDAYIQLAAIAYQEGNLTQTHAYLTQAQNLDPNNVAVTRLADFTSKLLE